MDSWRCGTPSEKGVGSPNRSRETSRKRQTRRDSLGPGSGNSKSVLCLREDEGNVEDVGDDEMRLSWPEQAHECHAITK